VNDATVAYFSMEIGLDPAIPTYSGGLGVLAGDTIRSAADLGVPMVAVTLLHRHGYFHQRLDALGRQTEEPVRWPVQDALEPLDRLVTVEVEGRAVQVRPWRYRVTGRTGFQVPVYLLDTDVAGNSPEDRTLTDVLYGGDARYRLSQEAVLGLGGVRMLRALGHRRLARFHMNEGHAALLVLALLEEHLGARAAGDPLPPEAIEAVREQCVFTTHTPVPAGHDQFPAELARQVLGMRLAGWLQACGQEAVLNMTDLALRCSRFINGVSMEHGEVSRDLFPGYPIRSITNGVHPVTWTAPSFQALYDRHLPGWRDDALSLRYAVSVPGPEIWEAHLEAKRALVEQVNRQTNSELSPDRLTVGYARRATAYKRPTLVFSDLERLRAIAEQAGPLQFVFAGKAHPRDEEGKEVIRRVFDAREALRGRIPVAYVPNYDMTWARLLTAGADVWLNTPMPPLEASGTSGMKAALNGVPSLSTLDGWWIEGHVEGVTGWAIGALRDAVPAGEAGRHALEARDAAALYDKLAGAVMPCFYRDREGFLGIMRSAIALNGSFFNTERMVWQYAHNAYRVAAP
jgi:starch phosphorylase